MMMMMRMDDEDDEDDEDDDDEDDDDDDEDDDDDDDPVDFFQTRGKWWELIVHLHYSTLHYITVHIHCTIITLHIFMPGVSTTLHFWGRLQNASFFGGVHGGTFDTFWGRFMKQNVLYFPRLCWLYTKHY